MLSGIKNMELFTSNVIKFTRVFQSNKFSPSYIKLKKILFREATHVNYFELCLELKQPLLSVTNLI